MKTIEELREERQAERLAGITLEKKQERLAGLIKRKAEELKKIEALQEGQVKLQEVIDTLEAEIQAEQE